MKVTVLPMNGLGNRLQALSSSSILAKTLGYRLEVKWPKQAVFSSDWKLLFDSLPGANSICDFPESNEFINTIPNFTQFEKHSNQITLRNLRLGDQRHMPRLRRLFKKSKSSPEVLIVTGEKFYFNGSRFFHDSDEFRSLRREYYSKVKFSSKIEEEFTSILQILGNEFWAIHLRTTDRIKEKVSNKRILHKIKAGRSKGQLSNFVYISSDDREAALYWKASLEALNFKVVLQIDIPRDRSSESEAFYAMTDWLVLSKASRIVSYGETTFSYEAAVAGGSFSNRIYVQDSLSRKIGRAISRNILAIRLYRKIPF